MFLILAILTASVFYWHLAVFNEPKMGALPARWRSSPEFLRNDLIAEATQSGICEPLE